MTTKGRRKEVDMVQVLVLAAGRSSRIESPITKMLHEVGQMKVLERVIKNLRSADLRNIFLIVGHQREKIMEQFPEEAFIIQPEQKGTGNAVLAAKGLKQGEHTLVVFGDKPLIQPHTLREFVETHLRWGNEVTASTVLHPRPDTYSEGYGTVMRFDGRILALRKTEETLECDGGMYLFKTNWLWDNIHRIRPHDNGRGKIEYFLPDLIEIAAIDGKTITEYRMRNYKEATGINTPTQLEEVERYLQAGQLK